MTAPWNEVRPSAHETESACGSCGAPLIRSSAHEDGDGCAIYPPGYTVRRRGDGDVPVDALEPGDYYADPAHEAAGEWLPVTEVVTVGDDVHVCSEPEFVTPEIAARIDADMRAAVAMPLPQMLAFLDGYTARYDAEIRRGEVLREQIRAYGDAALARERARLTGGE